MDIKLLIKNEGESSLKEIFLESCNKDLKKLFVVIGGMKETGFEVLEECLIDLKARKLLVLGLDKKYTTKKMLETLIKYTKSVYVYTKENVELSANIFVFEYTDRAEVYLASGNLSDSFFDDDKAIYTKICYDLTKKEDKESYAEYIDKIQREVKTEGYEKLEKELINTLAENKQIFTTKQYVHNVMSIAELLGNKEKKEKEVDENVERVEEDVNLKDKMPKIDLDSLDDIDIAVDVEDAIEQEIAKASVETKEEIAIAELKEEVVSEEKLQDMVEEYVENDDEEVDEDIANMGAIDIESMLFSKSHVKLDRKKVDKIIKEDRKQKEEEKPTQNKVIDLNKVTNVVMELKSKPTKGKDVNALKIPNQIRDLVPAFFETSKKAKNVEKDGSNYKEANITLEIIDIVANEKRKDNNAYISSKSAQSYFTIVSDEFVDVEYKEGDLARIIKLADDTYHIEIIPQELDEYNIWRKLCNQDLRGSTKRFGIM